MSLFKNVDIVKKANVYFDGKVTSRTVNFNDGSQKTLGFMLPGEYKFNTGKKELMEIYSGVMDVQFADSDKWITVKGEESFEVPGNSSFTVKVKEAADYCCSFID